MVYRYYTLAKSEEREMEEEFGETYRSYKERAPMFLSIRSLLGYSVNGIGYEKERFLLRTISSSLGLLSFYIIVLTFGNSFDHALSELLTWWPLLLFQLTGFGIQVGLFLHMRDLSKMGIWRSSATSLAIGGGVSASSMITCCLHHITDVLPIVGLSAIALFLANYQSVFMSLGVLSSIVGTTVMLEQLQRVSGVDYLSEGLSRALSRYHIRRIRDVTAIASGLIFIVLLAVALGVMPTARSDREATTIVKEQGGVTFSISSVKYDEAVGFKMRVDTHQGSLSFDLTEVATLTVEGEIYSPLSWRGSPPGGHHRSGELLFPKPRGAGAMTLVIRDVYGVPERVFEWGSATAASSAFYIWGGVSVITVAAIAMVFRARKSPEEYYQSLFEAKLRRLKARDVD